MLVKERIDLRKTYAPVVDHCYVHRFNQFKPWWICAPCKLCSNFPCQIGCICEDYSNYHARFTGLDLYNGILTHHCIPNKAFVQFSIPELTFKGFLQTQGIITKGYTVKETFEFYVQNIGDTIYQQFVITQNN